VPQSPTRLLQARQELGSFNLAGGGRRTSDDVGEGKGTRTRENSRTHSLTQQHRHVTTPQGRERHEIKKLSRRRRFAAAAASACLLPQNSASREAKSEEGSIAMKKKMQQQRRKQAARTR
jgi:hypothetical protein